MRLDKVYNVYNYDTSPVAITIGRDKSVLIPAGSDTNPSFQPLSMDEIIFANNSTKAFKIGVLRFDKSEEEEVYNNLRIHNWKEILTNAEIEDIFTNTTKEKLDFVLSIKEPSYFNRIYGIYLGLKNDGINMSSKVVQMMTVRYKEVAEGKLNTAIQIVGNGLDADNQIENKKDTIAEMQEQIAKLTRMVSESKKSNNKTTPTRSTVRNNSRKAKE
jgi:hypothetical protein